MAVFLAHLSIMFFVYGLYVSRRTPSWTIDQTLSAGAILTWTTLIAASVFLASFNQLGNQYLFFAGTLAFQGLFSALLIPKSDPQPCRPSWHQQFSKIKNVFSSWQKISALALLLILAGMALFMSLRTTLQIPDTLAMKLPNAYYYLRNGNFLPANSLTDDERLFSTPYNGTILWMYFIRFNQPVQVITFFNFIFWSLMLSSVYRIARQVGASQWSSFSAAALLCMTQNLLFQGSSDNDDLLSSVTCTMGIVFFFNWLKTRQLKELLIASLGIGISFGSKLFPALYAPAFAFCTLYYGSKAFKKNPAYFRMVLKHFTVSGIVIVSLILPFLVSRYLVAKGGSDFNTQMLSQTENKPFRTSVAAHNLIVYNLQLFASPITDSFFPSSGNQRSKIVDAFNDFNLKYFVPEVKNVFAYMPGVKISHTDLYDNTVWFGIFGWLVLIGIFLFLGKKEFRFSYGFWLVVFFLTWNIYFCVRAKYIEELGRYWILPLSLVAPAAALTLDYFAQENRFKHLKNFLVFSLWIFSFSAGYVGLKDNPIRKNFKSMIDSKAKPPEFPTALDKMAQECSEMNLFKRVYGYPSYWHMKQFFNARFEHRETISDNTPTIIPAIGLPILFHFYNQKFFPIPLGKNVGGIKYLGESGVSIPIYLSEDIECRCKAACSDNNSVLLAEVSAPLPVTPPIHRSQVRILKGSNRQTYEYRVTAEIDGKIASLREWNKDSDFFIDLPDSARILAIEARDSTGVISKGEHKVKVE